FAELELGAKWPELLDQIGGNGVALSLLEFGRDPPPALLVLSGKDERQVAKAYGLALRVVEDELARRGSKETVKRTASGSAEIATIGSDIHAARTGATILVSNKPEVVAAAMADAGADRIKHPLSARADAAKVLPKGALAWLWVNFAAVKETKQGK